MRRKTRASLMMDMARKKRRHCLEIPVRDFCRKGAHKTNKRAADSIGREVIRRKNQNLDDSKSGGLKGDNLKSGCFSEGWSEQKDYKVDIISFTTLQSGGPRGQCKVGYIYWQSGRLLKNGDVFIRSSFKQKCRKICGAHFERHCPATPDHAKRNNTRCFAVYWYDYCNIAVFIVSISMSIAGIWLIYSGNDRFIWRCPGIGIVTLASFGVWCLGFALDALWSILYTFAQIAWHMIRKKPRLKTKMINRIPLIVFTWMYLILSFAMAVLIQAQLYADENIIPFIIVWLAAGLAHRLLKAAGGRIIVVD